MQTRDQRYATLVHEQVKLVKDQDGYKRYGSLAHKLPILIHCAGLMQALSFVESRIDEKDIAKRILTDLAKTVGKNSAQDLLDTARTAPLGEYMLLTQQVLAALLWYKRFAQSILKVEASEAGEEDQ